MQELSPKLHRSRSLASAGLGAALAVLIVGASAPRAAAQSAPQSYNFNNQSDAAWTHFDYGIPPDENWFYPTNTYSFVTNTAGPAGNYAYKIQVPSYTNDPLYHLLPLGGTFLTDMTYGNTGDSTGGRFSVGSDLVAWNTVSDEMEVAIGWSANIPSWANPSAYFAGWGPGQKTLGMGVVVNGVGGGFGLIGVVTPGTTVLLTNHQYRIVTSTHDASTWVATIYDVAQPNSPWQSAITQDTSIATHFGNGGGGTVGLIAAILHQMLAPGDFPTQPAEATWDNFSVGAIPFVDPAGSVPANMPATVTDLSPTPAAQAFAPYLSIGFLNRDTGVNSSGNPTGWIKLYLDGVQIPSNQLTIDPNWVYKPYNQDKSTIGSYVGPQAPYPTNFPGATVNYLITNQFAYGTWHTNTVIFEDDQTISGQPVLHTNTWSWIAAWPPRFATTGSLSVRGFDARLVVATADFPGTVEGAETVLGYPSTNTAGVDLAATNWTQVVAWDVGNNGTTPWHDGAITNYPGLCYPTSKPNHFAVEVLGYIQLEAGTNNLYIASDDAVGVYTGANLTDTSTVLVQNNGVTHQAFTMFVTQAGLYPLHIIHQEGGGDAYLVLHSGTDNTGPLVNTPGAPQVYYPLVCMSSTSAKGPFTVDAAANAGHSLTTVSGGCDGSPTPGGVQNLTVTGGTLTFPIPSAPKYYRLNGPRQTKITSITKSGTNLVINYQAQ